MESLILSKLAEIELREQVCILHAVESGSRAWGFASPDSDFDVRFIYVRRLEHYLRLDRTRDVIEWQLDETLDINGWDLQKALRLLHKSNPTLFEWASSPIVYHTTPEWGVIDASLPGFFAPKPFAHHYLSMASSNYREYLKHDMVRVKKHLYVLRPLLACKWVLARQTPPPMLFADLVASEADEGLSHEIALLLDIKHRVSEVEAMPRIEPLNAFIEEAILQLESQVDALPKTKAKGYDELNRLFVDTVCRR
jgi:predicted nucleotidyltransferase